MRFEHQDATGSRAADAGVDQYVLQLRGDVLNKHYALGRQLLGLTEELYYPDMYIVAGMKRSLSLMRGFSDLVTSRNYMSAAPLVRLQLDNALRSAAIAMAADPHDFARRILQGERIDRLRDRTGEKLKDSLLVKRLSTQWPWVARAYEQGCDFVHFSGKHILVTFRAPDGEPSNKFSISEDNELVPEDAYRAAADVFLGATGIFLQYVQAWIREKKRIVADLKGSAEAT